MLRQIVLASENPGKIDEIQAILKDHAIVPQSDFNVPEAQETGLTFVENAIIKARNAARFSGLPAIADDSGLAVDALDGAPGIYSARYAGPGSSDRANLEKLLAMLADVPDDQREGRFICVIVFMRHENDPCPVIAQGVWEGRILREARGTNGFGYDPVFFAPEQGCASAELPPKLKNRLSHRAKALCALTDQLGLAW
ncbi:MAG: RdgB/HAM1 family non-canonical purine NTP pyrophosphatase [Pseudomonadota bacterium]